MVGKTISHYRVAEKLGGVEFGMNVETAQLDVDAISAPSPVSSFKAATVAQSLQPSK